MLLFFAVGINFSGLFVDVLGPDGTLYASIAKTMAETNNFSDLYNNGRDWLDKPHFPFWVAALSFKCFGIFGWSYKFPAILFVLVAALYTWLFTMKVYCNKAVAQWSVLILLTAQHIVLSNMDVRAEPYLTGLIIASIYHFHRSWTEKKFTQLVWASLFAACAVMTKGVFVLITIGAAVVGHLLVTKNFKEIFNWRWLVAAVLILIFITPELYTLYTQFDLHPEKLVFDTHGVSGIKFFFWDSQFGRFFNTGPIKGAGDPTFFLHTTLWAFLPWSILLYIALFNWIKKLVKKEPIKEGYLFFGGLITFLMFSLSKFQLPHYLNIVFPFFAILTSDFIYKFQNVKIIKNIQYPIIILIIIVLPVLHLFVKPDIGNVLVVVLMVIFLLLLVFLSRIFKVSDKEIAIGRSVLLVIVLNIYLNGIFYPELLKYQGGTYAGRYINQHYKGIPAYHLQARYNSPFQFYTTYPVTTIDQLRDTMLLKRPFLLLLQEDDDSTGKKAIQSFGNFPVSKLNGKFLNPVTRSSELKQYRLFLFEVK
ncbi:MAG: glycosyltransferase family 39 protein [Chitinophagaceae bacterium]|nr:glycosyltransferase family 39 protein [Chitinophagaceae bacterium]